MAVTTPARTRRCSPRRPLKVRRASLAVVKVKVEACIVPGSHATTLPKPRHDHAALPLDAFAQREGENSAKRCVRFGRLLPRYGRSKLARGVNKHTLASLAF
jgi:hypothetical protein